MRSPACLWLAGPERHRVAGIPEAMLWDWCCRTEITVLPVGLSEPRSLLIGFSALCECCCGFGPDPASRPASTAYVAECKWQTVKVNLLSCDSCGGLISGFEHSHIVVLDPTQNVNTNHAGRENSSLSTKQPLLDSFGVNVKLMYTCGCGVFVLEGEKGVYNWLITSVLIP